MISNLPSTFNRSSRGNTSGPHRASLLSILLTLLVPMQSFASESFPLGILGARGSVSADSSWIQVDAVDAESPAKKAGLLPGDKILGIDGSTFPNHSSKVDFGGTGPQRSLGEALDSKAARKKGKERTLTLQISRISGEEADEESLSLTIQLPFRPSIREQEGIDQLCQRARDQLLKSLKPAGYWDSPVGLTGDRVLTAWACLALMSMDSSSENESIHKILKWLQGPANRSWIPEDPLQKGPDNLGNWALTATAVALSEAQIRRPDEERGEVIQTICDALVARMDEEGLFGHDVSTGYKGKGFNVINTLSHLAWSISEIAGTTIPEESWLLSLGQIRKSIDPNGGIRYWTMKNTGTSDASLRTSSMALALNLRKVEEKIEHNMCNYLDRYNSRTREAHAVGSMGMFLAPAALWRHDREAYQRFLSEWRWYLTLMQNHEGKILYIGGKRNNGGDSYLGKNRIACTIALLILNPPRQHLRLYRSE